MSDPFHISRGPRRALAPGVGTTRQRARKGEGDRLREEILDAAEQLLIQKGSTDSVSMRAIADLVGVTPPSLYIHFADKDELFFQCCTRRFAELEEAVLSALQGGSALDRLQAISEAYIKFGIHRGEQYVAMWTFTLPDDMTEDEKQSLPGYQLLVIVAALIAEGMKTGEIRADVDPQQAAIALWGSVHGTALVLINKNNDPTPFPVDDAAVIDQTLTIIRRGLAR